MAWDFKMDGETRDWVFSASRDYAHVDGIDLVKQRVMTRLFIERGTFIYDLTGDLGSRAWELLKFPHWKSEEQMNIIVHEALAPMDDIEILAVENWHPGLQSVGQPSLITYEPDIRQLVVIIRVRLSTNFAVEATSSPLAEDIQVALALSTAGFTT